jgi:translation initiation factor 1
MPEVCRRCGLPLPLCVCRAIERGRIKIFVEKRRWSKQTTVIEGITDNVKQVASQLKTWLACGGTCKNDRIELQGDHRMRLKGLLSRLGYTEEDIEIA